jgi:AraC-like DNA-binding protein
MNGTVSRGRTVFSPSAVPGLEMVGRDFHSATLGLREHSHRGTEVCYLASGEVAWVVGRRVMRLVGGMISVIGPGRRHRGEFDAIAPSDLYWAVFQPGKLQPRPEPGIIRALTGRPYAVMAPGLVRGLFDGILGECAAAAPGWAAAAGALVTRLAVECARLATSRSSAAVRVPGPIAEAARVLSERLESPPSMRELARTVGLGPTRFHALFRQRIGLTPRDYLRRLRLARAREELAAAASDITTLAIRLGFQSSQQFATTFRKYTGLTPSEFRRRAERKG